VGRDATIPATDGFITVLALDKIQARLDTFSGAARQAGVICSTGNIAASYKSSFLCGPLCANRRQHQQICRKAAYIIPGAPDFLTRKT
jgi:hypothetical protein